MHMSAPTRSPRRGAATGAGLLVALVLAAGCSGDSDASSSSGANSGPLAELLGYDQSPAEGRAMELQTQQAIAECMKAEGWEYQAVDFNSSNPYQDEYDEQIADPQAYGEKYGYGVVRSYDLGLEQQTAQPVTDPNADYVNSLSVDEQQSYQESLYGAPQEAATDGGDPVVVPLDQQGCYGTAQAEVYGDSPMSDPDIGQRLEELGQAAQDDPAVRDANDIWAACMSDRDASYDFASPDEIYSYLYGKLGEAQGFGPAPAPDVAASGFTRGVNPGDTLPEADQGAIDDLRAEELQLWTDDQACQAEAKIPEVRRDAEQRIVDQLIQEFPELGGT